jgi:hypothetical protein
MDSEPGRKSLLLLPSFRNFQRKISKQKWNLHPLGREGGWIYEADFSLLYHHHRIQPHFGQTVLVLQTCWFSG